MKGAWCVVHTNRPCRGVARVLNYDLGCYYGRTGSGGCTVLLTSCCIWRWTGGWVVGAAESGEYLTCHLSGCLPLIIAREGRGRYLLLKRTYSTASRSVVDIQSSQYSQYRPSIESHRVSSVSSAHLSPPPSISHAPLSVQFGEKGTYIDPHSRKGSTIRMYPFTENLQGPHRDVRVPARIHPTPWDKWEWSRGPGGRGGR
jgi:hypothetical protein